MARPNLSEERRRELLPIVTATFAELGYRRTTTAELAGRCDVQETVLYRLWPDKKAMFLAAIDHVFETSVEAWQALLEAPSADAPGAERVLSHEARHQGDQGHHRIVFAGLTETDDPQIRKALAAMYRRFHRFIREQVVSWREAMGVDEGADASLAAWAIVGLGTMANICRELDLVAEGRRRRLIDEIGRALLGTPCGS